jgi:hypothetical protein
MVNSILQINSIVGFIIIYLPQRDCYRFCCPYADWLLPRCVLSTPPELRFVHSLIDDRLITIHHTSPHSTTCLSSIELWITDLTEQAR